MSNDAAHHRLLTESQKTLLHRIIEARAPNLLHIVERINVQPVPLEQRNLLRDHLLDEYLDSGVRKDWEPNAYGLEVDDIIGALGP